MQKVTSSWFFLSTLHARFVLIHVFMISSVVLPCYYYFGLLSYALALYSFSKSVEFANIENCFKYLLTSSNFRTGHSSSLEVYAISFSLSLSSISQSNTRWSVVWSPWVQTHSGDWIVLKRCRYALVFLCAVTIDVKLGDSLRSVFSRALISGKNCLVTNPLAVASHCCCHFAMVFSDSCRSISLFDILL